jgi:hypothetical protein
VKAFSNFLLMLLVLAGAGCTGVLVDEPFGKTPARLVPEDWNGTWQVGESAVLVNVMNPEAGLLRVGWAEEDDGVFRLETRELFARRVNQSLFLTLVDTPKAGVTNQHWYRVVMRSDELEAWVPDCDVFKRLVTAGKLPGVVSNDVVFLKGLSVGQLDRIEQSKEAQFFEMKETIKLRRLKSN